MVFAGGRGSVGEGFRGGGGSFKQEVSNGVYENRDP